MTKKMIDLFDRCSKNLLTDAPRNGREGFVRWFRSLTPKGQKRIVRITEFMLRALLSEEDFKAAMLEQEAQLARMKGAK